MGLADLHIHTLHSFDGTARVADVLRRASAIGLDVVAITDHDVIEGALEALELAPQYGIEVIPGIEITTADGDLLAYNVQRAPAPRRGVIDTLLEVGEMGGFCVAAHPMAGGWTMKSLSAYAIWQATRHERAARILLGLEAFNATTLDRNSNNWANNLAERLGLAKTGSSDAHVLGAIGSGATWFPGHTTADLVAALRSAQTEVRRHAAWRPLRVLGSWLVGYTLAAPQHLIMNLRRRPGVSQVTPPHAAEA